jgi:hypothetical protein
VLPALLSLSRLLSLLPLLLLLFILMGRIRAFLIRIVRSVLLALISHEFSFRSFNRDIAIELQAWALLWARAIGRML